MGSATGSCLCWDSRSVDIYTIYTAYYTYLQYLSTPAGVGAVRGGGAAGDLAHGRGPRRGGRSHQGQDRGGLQAGRGRHQG